MTKDYNQRLNEHNKGKVKSTKLKRPWHLIYKEEYPNLTQAREREKYLKSYKGVSEKRQIIEKFKIKYSEIV